MCVVGNLRRNATEASPAGGDVRAVIRRHEDEVSFTVSDRATRVDVEGHAELFEPFFTTGPGRARPLALALADADPRGFAHMPAPGGHQDLLPLAPSVCGDLARRAHAMTATVLLVDDRTTRESLASTLTEPGYQAVGSRRGRPLLERSPGLLCVRSKELDLLRRGLAEEA